MGSSTERSSPESGRLAWVDNAKAIAIWLIVLGHTQKLLPDGVIWFVYAFHVPVFLLMSGALLPPNPLQKGFGSAFEKRIMPLVRYYLFFSALSALLFCLRNVVAGNPTDVLRLIWGILYGSSGGDVFGYAEGIIHENRPLWYFPFLVSSLLILLVCLRLRGMATGIAIFLLMLASIYLPRILGHRWPWSMDVAGVGAFFLFLGWALRDKINRMAHAGLSWIALLAIVALAFCAVWAITVYNGPMNINGRRFGSVPPLAILGACLGCIGLIALSVLLPNPTILQRLSRHTLVIFVVHKYPLDVFQLAVHKAVPLALQVPAGVIISLLVTYLCLLLSERISDWLARHIGRKPI